MDVLTLLDEARAAGLSIRAEGGRLVIRGPRQAEPMALRLIEAKPMVMAALAEKAANAARPAEFVPPPDFVSKGADPARAGEKLPKVASHASPVTRRAPNLDPATVLEVLGNLPDPHDLAIVRFQVMAAVAQLEAEVSSGTVEARVRLVRGRPLCDWLDLDEVARLLRAGGARR